MLWNLCGRIYWYLWRGLLSGDFYLTYIALLPIPVVLFINYSSRLKRLYKLACINTPKMQSDDFTAIITTHFTSKHEIRAFLHYAIQSWDGALAFWLFYFVTHLTHSRLTYASSTTIHQVLYGGLRPDSCYYLAHIYLPSDIHSLYLHFFGQDQPTAWLKFLIDISIFFIRNTRLSCSLNPFSSGPTLPRSMHLPCYWLRIHKRFHTPSSK